MIDANTVLNSMNSKMLDKNSDVLFHWSATSGGEANPKGYFLLWGFKKSDFTYENAGPSRAVFLFKGMADMLEGLLAKDGELGKFEDYVKANV